MDAFMVKKEQSCDISITPFKICGKRCSMHGTIGVWNISNLFLDPYEMLRC